MRRLDAFGVDRSRASLRSAYCRSCKAFISWDRRRLGLERSSHRERYAANPDAFKAHNAVRRAVREGRLVRPEVCPQCGFAGRPVEAHHESYAPADWLTVTWLCRSCHTIRHR